MRSPADLIRVKQFSDDGVSSGPQQLHGHNRRQAPTSPRACNHSNIFKRDNIWDLGVNPFAVALTRHAPTDDAPIATQFVVVV